MSGTVISDVGRFTALNPLIERNASALKVELTNREAKDNLAHSASIFVTFRSGAHRLLGSRKSSADKISNASSLKVALDYIERVGGKTARERKAVRERVEQGVITLAGDKSEAGKTVKERMERGTYVSSEVLRQLQALAIAAYDKEKFVETNQGTAQRFLTGSQLDANGFIVAREKSGVMEVIDELANRQQGPGANHPSSWEMIGKHFKTATVLNGNENDEFVHGLWTKLQAAAKVASDAGREVHYVELQTAAEKYLLSEAVLSRFTKDANRKLCDDVASSTTNLADLSQRVANNRPQGEGVPRERVNTWLETPQQDGMIPEASMSAFKQFVAAEVARENEKESPRELTLGSDFAEAIVEFRRQEAKLEIQRQNEALVNSFLQPGADRRDTAAALARTLSADENGMWAAKKYPESWNSVLGRLQQADADPGKSSDPLVLGLGQRLNELAKAATEQFKSLTLQALQDEATAYLTDPAVFGEVVKSLNSELPKALEGATLRSLERNCAKEVLASEVSKWAETQTAAKKELPEASLAGLREVMADAITTQAVSEHPQELSLSDFAVAIKALSQEKQRLQGEENQAAVQSFIGANPNGASGSGGNGLTQLIGELRDESQAHQPRQPYERSWAAAHDHFQKAPGNGGNIIDKWVAGLHDNLGTVATRAAQEHRLVTTQELRDAARGYLTMPAVFASFVNTVNKGLIESVRDDDVRWLTTLLTHVGDLPNGTQPDVKIRTVFNAQPEMDPSPSAYQLQFYMQKAIDNDVKDANDKGRLPKEFSMFDFAPQIHGLAKNAKETEARKANGQAVSDFLGAGITKALADLLDNGTTQWPAADYRSSWAVLNSDVRRAVEQSGAHSSPQVPRANADGQADWFEELRGFLTKIAGTASQGGQHLTSEDVQACALGFLTAESIFPRFVRTANEATTARFVMTNEREAKEARDARELALIDLVRANEVYPKDARDWLVKTLEAGGRIAGKDAHGHLDDMSKAIDDRLRQAATAVKPEELTRSHLVSALNPILAPLVERHAQTLQDQQAEQTERQKRHDAAVLCFKATQDLANAVSDPPEEFNQATTVKGLIASLSLAELATLEYHSAYKLHYDKAGRPLPSDKEPAPSNTPAVSASNETAWKGLFDRLRSALPGQGSGRGEGIEDEAATIELNARKSASEAGDRFRRKFLNLMFELDSFVENLPLLEGKERKTMETLNDVATILAGDGLDLHKHFRKKAEQIERFATTMGTQYSGAGEQTRQAMRAAIEAAHEMTKKLDDIDQRSGDG